MKKVAVVGLGYVGLPLAVAILESGQYEVVGFDINQAAVDKINNSESPFFDKDLSERLKNIELEATTDANDVKEFDYYLICVPTPVDDDHEPNLGPVKSASKMIAGVMKKGSTVIVESTINPGVCEEVVLPVLEEESGMKGGKDFELAHCPERINPGDEKWNVYNIARNVGALGGKKAAEEVAEFYRSFLDAEINPVSSLKVAEATKIIENTFRDINIAYVNELAKSFDVLGIDLKETIEGASNKPFGFMAHYPGCGVGGHCIPVDPYYLIKRAKESGFDHKFLRMARSVNNSMPEYTVDLLARELNELGLPIKGTKILLYGMSYKADVGDLRESPSLVILDILKERGADVETFDPYLEEHSTVKSLKEGLQHAEAMLVATAHTEIKNVDVADLKQLKVIVDGRNKLDKQALEAAGIDYKGIGH